MMHGQKNINLAVNLLYISICQTMPSINLHNTLRHTPDRQDVITCTGKSRHYNAGVCSPQFVAVNRVWR